MCRVCMVLLISLECKVPESMKLLAQHQFMKSLIFDMMPENASFSGSKRLLNKHNAPSVIFCTMKYACPCRYLNYSVITF